MSGFPQGEAELVAFFIESVMWGIQLVTFILCLWMITGTVNSRTAKQRTIFTFTSWPLVYASGLFTIGTVHLCLSLYDILQAFVFYKGVGGADNQYNEISGTSRAYNAWNFPAALVADAALIHRCWVMCCRKWKYVTLSIFIWLGGFAVACAEAFCFSYGKQDIAGVLSSAFAICGGILNVYTTGLILYRIRIAERARRAHPIVHKTHPQFTVRWSKLARVIIDSALLYTLVGIAFLITSLTGSNAQHIMISSIVQLAGIQFQLVVIRVGRGMTSECIGTESHRHEAQVDTNPGNPSASMVSGGTRTSVQHITAAAGDAVVLKDVRQLQSRNDVSVTGIIVDVA